MECPDKCPKRPSICSFMTDVNINKVTQNYLMGYKAKGGTLQPIDL